MRTIEVSGVNLKSMEAQTKWKASRKRRRGEGVYVTSRYFQGIAPADSPFRFAKAVSPDTNNDSEQSNEMQHHRGRKISVQEDVVENQNYDQTLGYNMFVENKCDKLVDRNGVTSDYFLRSPSSAYGSVRSLGSLVYTWIGSRSRDEIRSRCTRRISGYQSGKPCEECSKILAQEAFRHFQDCSIFQRALDSCKVNFDRDTQATCVEVVGRWAEQHALRHLCTNQCFLRAFAPSRDWLSLRKHLKTIAPIGDTLDNWTCRLVHETKKDTAEAIECNRSPLTCQSHCDGFKIVKLHRKVGQGILPRTIFVSHNTGKSFVSIQNGQKHVLAENDKERAVKTQIAIDNESESLRFEKNFSNDTISKVESPFGLIEELFPEEPWRILVCTMLLNKTQRKQNVDSILYHLFLRWPTAESVVKDADLDEEEVHLFVFALVKRAGQGHRKSRGLVQLSRDYLLLLESKNQQIIEKNISPAKRVELELTRADVKQLFCCGDYAADAYQIFIRKDFETPIVSNDQMLLAYVEWKRSLSYLP